MPDDRRTERRSVKTQAGYVLSEKTPIQLGLALGAATLLLAIAGGVMRFEGKLSAMMESNHEGSKRLFEIKVATDSIGKELGLLTLSVERTQGRQASQIMVLTTKLDKMEEELKLARSRISDLERR